MLKYLCYKMEKWDVNLYILKSWWCRRDIINRQVKSFQTASKKIFYVCIIRKLLPSTNFRHVTRNLSHLFLIGRFISWCVAARRDARTASKFIYFRPKLFHLAVLIKKVLNKFTSANGNKSQRWFLRRRSNKFSIVSELLGFASAHTKPKWLKGNKTF